MCSFEVTSTEAGYVIFPSDFMYPPLVHSLEHCGGHHTLLETQEQNLFEILKLFQLGYGDAGLLCGVDTPRAPRLGPRRKHGLRSWFLPLVARFCARVRF